MCASSSQATLRIVLLALALEHAAADFRCCAHGRNRDSFDLEWSPTCLAAAINAAFNGSLASCTDEYGCSDTDGHLKVSRCGLCPAALCVAMATNCPNTLAFVHTLIFNPPQLLAGNLADCEATANSIFNDRRYAGGPKPLCVSDRAHNLFSLCSFFRHLSGASSLSLCLEHPRCLSVSP